MTNDSVSTVSLTYASSVHISSIPPARRKVANLKKVSFRARLYSNNFALVSLASDLSIIMIILSTVLAIHLKPFRSRGTVVYCTPRALEAMMLKLSSSGVLAVALIKLLVAVAMSLSMLGSCSTVSNMLPF